MRPRRLSDDGDVPPTTLDRRTLNRTLLERQGLLRRSRRSVRDVLVDLVGMQAQEPQNPFVALWTRLDGFDPDDLDRLLLEREAVRTGLMRTTLHLVTTDDALALRPLFAPVLSRVLQSQRQFRIGLEGLDLSEIAAVGAARLAQRPMPAGELRPLLAQRWPDRDPAVLMMAVRYLVPIVQVPPRGLWQRSRQPTLTTLAAWAGREPAEEGNVEAAILRYLRAFGPASSSDVRTWSWLTGLGPVTDRLRPHLRAFRDESGRELLDVPDAPIVDGAEPAPVRFLPEYDNVFLSHADRSRITDPAAEIERWVRGRGALLVDGFGAAGWRLSKTDGSATLSIRPFRPLVVAERGAVEAEADALLGFLAAEADRRQITWQPEASA
jgi:hypothetical protein